MKSRENTLCTKLWYILKDSDYRKIGDESVKYWICKTCSRNVLCRSRVIPKHLLLFMCFPHSYDTGNSNDSFYSDRFYEFSSVGHDPVERVATFMYTNVLTYKYRAKWLPKMISSTRWNRRWKVNIFENFKKIKILQLLQIL